MPPCWPNPVNGKPEYALDVQLLPTRLEVVGVWPAHREADASKIPGLKELAQGVADLESFHREASKVLLWSNEHECRHYVRIIDSPDTDKATFKRLLLLVENYFYKYLVQ